MDGTFTIGEALPRLPNGVLPTWTPQRITALCELWEAGVTTMEMGRLLTLVTPEAGPVSKMAVIGKVHRLGLVPRVVKEKAPPRRNIFDFTGPACVWPIGHPTDAAFHFCGGRPVTGKPYCGHHAAVAYVPPKIRDATLNRAQEQ